jgi:hypothetical protein
MLMDGLLFATGFTGALTLVWLARRLNSLLRHGPAVSAHFGAEAAAVLAREISRARREVLVLGTPAGADVIGALGEARSKAAIDLLLDPRSDPAPFALQGLQPRPAVRPTPPGLLVIVDDRVLLASSSAPGEPAGLVVVACGHSDLIQSCRQQFAAHHPVSQQPAPVPQPEPAPVVEAPKPEAAPSTSPVDDLLAAVARGAVTEEEEEEEATAPETRAAGELLARLRKETGAAGQDDASEKAA